MSKGFVPSEWLMFLGSMRPNLPSHEWQCAVMIGGTLEEPRLWYVERQLISFYFGGGSNSFLSSDQMKQCVRKYGMAQLYPLHREIGRAHV